MLSLLSFALLFFADSGFAQGQDSLPARLPQVEIDGRDVGTCPSAEVTEQARNGNKEEIHSILRDTVVPILDPIIGRCPCGGPGQWRRIAHLNMTDSNQQCPSNWRLITSPSRGCGRLNDNTCNSAVFPSSGSSYSRVCGRVNAIHRGTPDAFFPFYREGNNRIDSVYLDGLSLTHGSAGSRQHIWTFAAALLENDPNYAGLSLNVCPCTNTDFNYPHQVPSFIGNNYFCDTANTGPGYLSSDIFPENPLWDGEGCGPTNACCQFNNPPWFCTTLPQPTTDDIELRICSTQGISNEDVYVQLLDIYVL